MHQILAQAQLWFIKKNQFFIYESNFIHETGTKINKKT